MDVASRGVSAIVEYDYAAQEPDELDLIKGALIHSIKQMPGGWWEGTLQSNGKTGMFPDNFVRVIDNSDENKVTMRDKAATANRRCKVIFSYTQVNDDELSLAVGDVIEFLGEVEEGWWRGRLKSKIGVFPSNFVTVIEPSPILASKRPTAGPSASTIATSAAAAVAAAAAAAANKSNIAAHISGGASNSSSTSTSHSNAIVNNNSSTPAATATASTAPTTKKMTNRLSYHSSKEDLLNSSSSHSNNGLATTTTTNTSIDDVAPSLPPKPQREYCRVEYPYAPQNDDELELKVGEIITIISTDLPDKGWWKGELHGKVGVFPDNFVKLIDVTSLSDSHQAHPQRTANKTSNNANNTGTSSSSAANIRSATGAAITAAAHTTAATSKVFIKKTGSNSSTQSSNRKDSFGSYDSLNDILSETGLQSGNVAAQRKSLENKNLDLTANALKKQQLQQQQQHLQETQTSLTNNGGITTTTTTQSSSATTTNMSASSAAAAAVANELRKSLESLDEKTKTPPPVLTKKPTVTTKKPSSVTGVASNLFGFGKQKTKSHDSKMTTAASQDHADGIGSSKMSTSNQGDAVVLRRAATIASEDADFDRLERSSILPDMRAGRVKAPKRRPPSAAINIIGESNNNNTIYLNGSGGGGGGGGASGSELSQEEGKLQSSDDNSTGEEQLAKPKPREWEKKKAPWMEELKASQVKKKTSPSVEPRTQGAAVAGDRTSRLLSGGGDDLKAANSNHNFASSTASNSITGSSSSSHTTTTTTKVQQHHSSSSSTVSSSTMQQSMIVESSQQLMKKELNSNNITAADIMTKSMSNHNKFTTDSASNAGSGDDVLRTRPNSLSIRNRSISPALAESGGGSVSAGSGGGGGSARSTTTNTAIHEQVAAVASSNGTPAASSSSSSAHNSTGAYHHQQQQQQRSSLANSSAAAPATATAATDSARIGELERRVGKLEFTVVAQQRTIDELVRLLREETDRVKVLRGELDKYAQCVTQV